MYTWYHAVYTQLSTDINQISDIHSSVDPGLWDALAHGVHKKTLQVHGRRGLA
jgi:hypothetical protein